MNIVLVTNSLDMGGVETNLVGLADALSRRGHDIRVVSSGGVLLPDLQARGVRHILSPVRLGVSDLARSAWTVRHSLGREAATVVHTMSAAANLAALARPDRSGTVLVSSPMGLAQSDQEPAWKTAFRNRLMVLGTQRVLAISVEIERALLDIGVPSTRLRRCAVVGIDLGRFAVTSADGRAVRRELGIDPDVPIVTTIGALHVRKRHDLFIDAAEQVARSIPEAQFLIVGEGAELVTLRTRAEQKASRPVIRFLGQRRDVARILAATDVYVKPGIVEGFVGITVLEALAAGVPVVAFDTRDVRAAILDDVTGLLAPAGDPSALARQVVLLLRDRSRAAAIAAAGHDHVQREFALPAVASRLEDAYREALESRV